MYEWVKIHILLLKCEIGIFIKMRFVDLIKYLNSCVKMLNLRKVKYLGHRLTGRGVDAWATYQLLSD